MEMLRAGIGVSTLSPLGTTVSLLVTFEKARYPSYHINVTEQLFRSRLEFQQWEAANELHHLIQRSHRSNFIELRPLLEKNISVFNKTSSDPLVEHLLNAKDNHASSALTRSMLLVMCSLVHLFQRQQRDSQRPAFLSMIDAGYILVSACHGHIGVLEKEPYKDYELVVLVLRLLLSSPYSPSRRAKWYRRLAIDLDVHLKKDGMAVECLQSSLKDPFVKVYPFLNDCVESLCLVGG